MFEAFTYEVILEDMLSRVTNDVDKREGSMIYDALAPAAYHLAKVYFYLDTFFDLVSGDTAIGSYLDRIAADQGLTRKESTYAVRKVVTSGSVAIGTRWGFNDTTYTIVELLSVGVYSARCEQVGNIGNIYAGTLENIDNVSGITATLTDIITAGEDVESDEDLRNRYFTKVKTPITSGNTSHYKLWATEVAGIGDAKVFPLWNGPGSVKVVVIGEDRQPVNTPLIDLVTQHIESVRPIGASVSIVTATSKLINIKANVNLAPGYSIQAVLDKFSTGVIEYLKSAAFTQDYVSYAQVGSILLNTEGVIDYTLLKLNNTTSNIGLGVEEVPTAGTIELEV